MPRKLKVTKTSGQKKDNGMFSFFPFIKLAGKWLMKAGFKPGDHVNIEAVDGIIIITKI